MNNQDLKIVVSGDICINTLMWATSPQEYEGLNWKSQTHLHNLSKPGGALLLAEMTSLATGMPVIAPLIPENVGPYTNIFLHSFVEIEPFPSLASLKEDSIFRVRRYMGYTDTQSGQPELLNIQKDDADAQIVMIDDENNGFNARDQFWPLALRETKKTPVVLYKMNNPIGESLLWQHLECHHIDRTIVIINADDLRSKGVNISKSLSWEKTALDFVWQLSNNPNLSFLATCRHLIVPFGLEGSIYYSNDSCAESYLYFLPYAFEGDFARENPGQMYGLTSAFVAGLSAALIKDDGEGLGSLIPEGIRNGMLAARKHFELGFGSAPEHLCFPSPEIFQHNEPDALFLEQVQDAKIPNIMNIEHQDCWFILHEKSSASIAQIAFDLVKNGDENVLKYIPTARFGRLKTVDRTEIESYRTIRNLISEYISTKNTARPLSIAVFGTPGSGKSYGLTEMAASAFPEDIQKMNYNLSQFRAPLELRKAFHKISDYNLLGKIPLIVFDEFDSYFEGNLGWLKYFLSPMQDGVYRGEESIHPIGKAIFVFAGGTSSSFSEFCGEKTEGDGEKRSFLREFKAAKGPDFVSRLRGYIDILGPNQTDDGDQLFMIRRAMLMRSLLERKLPHLINEKGEAQIDNGVLRAMLKIPRYKHESRSVEAIMDMSILTQAKKWEQSFLPPKEQLRLHLDEKQFLRYMMHDAILSEKVDVIAQLLRKKFHALNGSIPIEGDAPSLSWRDLGDAQKTFYKNHVKNIPEALLQVQYDVIYVDSKPEELSFSQDELAELEKFEYKRRKNMKTEDVKQTLDQTLSGQAAAPSSGSLAKEELKMQIHQMVGLWSTVLSESNFKLERLRFVDKCSLLKN